MAGPEITKLKNIIREKALPPGIEPPLEQMRKAMEKVAFRVADDVKTEPVTVAGRPAEWVRAPGIQAGRAILYLHGGGYVMGSINTHRSLAGEVSRAAQALALVVGHPGLAETCCRTPEQIKLVNLYCRIVEEAG